jgi:uncharacterized membrane protein
MKCLYCGKECEGRFCSDECDSRAQSYQERVDKVNEAALVLTLMAVMVVFAVVSIIFGLQLSVGLMLLIIGLIFVPYPFVNTDTFEYMCIRTSILLMRAISAVFILVGCIALCLYIW